MQISKEGVPILDFLHFLQHFRMNFIVKRESFQPELASSQGNLRVEEKLPV